MDQAVNEGKTNYTCMLATSRNVTKNELVAGNYIFEAVHDSVFLTTTINSTIDVKVEIQR